MACCRCCCQSGNLCRAGVWRCWYCGRFLLIPFWFITLGILSLALYYSITYSMKNEDDIVIHLMNFGLVWSAYFTMLLIQITYIVVLFENKCKCGRILFWVLYVFAFILCMLAFISVALSYKLGKEEGGSGSNKGNFGRSAEVAAPENSKGGSPDESSNKGESQAGAEKAAKSDNTDTADTKKGDGQDGAEKEAKSDNTDTADTKKDDKKEERRKRQDPEPKEDDKDKDNNSKETETEKGDGDGQEEKEKNEDKKDGENKKPPTGKIADSREPSSSKNSFSFSSLTPTMIKAICAGIILVMLIFILHIYLYYGHIVSGERDAGNCEGSSSSGSEASPSFGQQPSSSRGNVANVRSDDIANANLGPRNSISSRCRELLKNRVGHWSGEGTNANKKKCRNVKIFYVNL